MPSQTRLLGAADEHHVMSELLRRGYIAALAPQGVPNADIVVCNVEGTQLVSIQVTIARQWFRLSLAWLHCACCSFLCRGRLGRASNDRQSNSFLAKL